MNSTEYEMSLSSRHLARILDPERLWQVRRFCQVRRVPAQSSDEIPQSPSSEDAALAALLRCLLHELDADLAAVSLLDEQTQYFPSVVHAADSHNPTIRSSDWFGCQQIPTVGGICNKTISCEYESGKYPVYEILDLTKDETTKFLPVVDGSTANFKYYAGVPITAADDFHIGALFIFRNRPSAEAMCQTQQRYMYETASHMFNQLSQTVAAIENSRSLRCNQISSAFLQTDFAEVLGTSPQALNTSSQQSKVRYATVSDVYRSAADSLLQMFDMDGVIIQSLPHPKASMTSNIGQEVRILGQAGTGSGPVTQPLSSDCVNQLCKAFPTGAILQLLSARGDGVFLSSTQQASRMQERPPLLLGKELPDCEQCMFVPLKVGFDEHNTAFILGWTSRFERVYSYTNDLPALLAFETSINFQLRRLKATLVSRTKSDFLASMSHEMRSPLHGLLACIRGLQEKPSPADGLDLLNRAEVCGTQLQNNMDKILAYANIGTSGRTLAPSQRQTSMISWMETTISKLAQMHRAMKLSLHPQDLTTEPPLADMYQGMAKSVHQPAISFDAHPAADFLLEAPDDLAVVVENILDNCLKFSDTNPSIRVSLRIVDTQVEMSFVDSGRGMAETFTRHGLFVPFSQEDPLNDGVGLGLILAQKAVQELGGSISVDTSVLRGTSVSVLLPLQSIMVNSQQPVAGLACTKGLAANPQGFSSWSIRLFSPLQWKQLDGLRREHCSDILLSSLTCTLRDWVAMDLRIWDKEESLPNVIIVFGEDVESLRHELGEDFPRIHKLICFSGDPDSPTSKWSEPNFGMSTLVFQPLTPSKICAALQSLWEQASPDSYETRNEIHNEIDSLRPDLVQPENNGTLIYSESSEQRQNLGRSCDERIAKISDSVLDLQIEDEERDPTMLLVDDNAINLKVLSMYAKKCTSRPFTLAGGGQQAIDAFRSAWYDPEKPSFDVAVLDLSMPEVSGFDVASAIRDIEKEDKTRQRTYITALTGLTSEEDRRAAFAAGVDEYMTKPATVTDLQSFISNWSRVKRQGDL